MKQTIEAMKYDKNNPFFAKMIESRRLTKETSDKETRLFVLDITGSELKYKPGDSLGIYPSNNESDVDFILKQLNLNPESKVLSLKGELLTIKHLLIKELNIASLTKRLIECLHTKTINEITKQKLSKLLDSNNEELLRKFLEDTSLREFLEDYKDLSIEAHDLTQLKRLMPRLYSIASSQNLYPNQVHIAVSMVRYLKPNGKLQKGLTSSFLSERVTINEAMVPIFITNSPFQLPANNSTDIILVGPGTGVAPFRAFIQERIYQKASGRNWLFFGDRHRASDFLFEEEWTNFLKNKNIYRMDLAFSRDQEQKIYVQDRMNENAAELWKWLQSGASFYICGEASRMAKDVEKTLIEIIQKQGELSQEQANNYLKQMRQEKRYQKDVY